MNLFVLVNEIDSVDPEQTTTLLVHAALRRGWVVCLAGVDDLLLLPDDRIMALARHPDPEVDSPVHLVEQLRAAPRRAVDLGAQDAILIRTNPGRLSPVATTGHDAALQLLAMLSSQRGGLVLNDPLGLLRAQSKLYLSSLPPAFRPDTLVTRDRATLMAFVQARERCVLKPLRGTRGQDVFFVDRSGSQNLAQIVDVLLRDGVAMAQSYLPEAPEGDTRILLLEGEPLIADGVVAAVRRRPGAGELRSNVAQGGTPERAHDLSPVLDVARAIGARLRADGLFLAGLDVIGRRAVEVNVFSPGGLLDAGRFEGVDFLTPILDGVAARVASRRA